LISRGGASVGSVWLFANGEDLFVPVDDVVEIWPGDGSVPRAA
jgi:hypothetical protein